MMEESWKDDYDKTLQSGTVVDLAQIRATQSLRESLAKSEKGAPLPTVANLIAILRHDPVLDGLLASNSFTCEAVILRAPPVPDDAAAPLPGPYPRTPEPADVSLIHAYVQRVWVSHATETAVYSAIAAATAMRAFHPVRDWLGGLLWDGNARLDGWLYRAFGAEPSDYHADVGAKFLIAAVRRVRRPGCKFDYMPILKGAQGIGKSTALAVLFSPEWFTDSIPHDLGNKDAAMAVLGRWCIEMAEIDQLIRGEMETIKGFLTRQVERFRPPFARSIVTRPRQCVLVGTTNSDEFLRDSTGNRRFWPVTCTTADVEWVRANREQLWAEAAARETSGEAIWLTDESSQVAALEIQAAHVMEDAWEDKIATWCALRTQVTVPEIMADCLLMAAKDQTKGAQMRVGAVLKQHGWERVVRWSENRARRLWVRGIQ